MTRERRKGFLWAKIQNWTQRGNIRISLGWGFLGGCALRIFKINRLKHICRSKYEPARSQVRNRGSVEITEGEWPGKRKQQLSRTLRIWSYIQLFLKQQKEKYYAIKLTLTHPFLLKIGKIPFLERQSGEGFQDGKIEGVAFLAVCGVKSR